VQDTVTGEIFYFYYNKDRSGEILELIEKLKLGLKVPELIFEAKFLGHSLTQNQHRQKVLNTIEEIKAGNSFQAEVGMKSRFEISGNPLAVYQKLRKVNPSPFMFFCKFADQIVLGASPELLLRLKNGELQTSPLAGTVKRGKGEVEDKLLARKLLNDPKEIAEHNMLVDMHRNDIGTVSRFGTVKVRNLMEIKRFSHVQHISSDVVGILDPQKDGFDALAAILPGGVVSGAPRLETVKIIQRNEIEPRGVYGGALGHFGLNGNCTFTLPIRSLFISKNKAYAQTSSGIVYDSDPQKEYDELVNKLAAMKSVLEGFEG
jgi:anthranilate synthase component 1